MKLITLEIGSSAVKIGLASFDADVPDSPLTLQAVESEPLLNCVRNGRIQNVEDVKNQTLKALERLRRRPELEGAEITGVYAAIGGRSLSTVNASANLALPDERLITDELVERLKSEAMASVDSGKDVLEIIPRRFAVNDAPSARPVGAYGSKISGDFTIVVCDQLNSRNIERVVLDRLDLNICEYVVRPLAIARAVLTAEDTNPGCMLVDMGAETTTVAIFKEGSPRYIATIPMGGRNITRDLMAGMGITEERAEEIKLRVGNALNDGAPASADRIEIDSYIQARALEIASNIAAHIGFAGYGEGDLRAGIIVTGGAARLKNMGQLLKNATRLPVRMAVAPAAVHIQDSSIDPAENLDVIALTLAARTFWQAQGNADICVTEPLPVDDTDADEPEEETGAADTPAADTPLADYDPSNPFSVDDRRDEDDDEEEDLPPNRRSYDPREDDGDDGDLTDDDTHRPHRSQKPQKPGFDKRLADIFGRITGAFKEAGDGQDME